MVMPKRNGTAVHDEIRCHTPDVRTIFMSGYGSDKIIADGHRMHNVNVVSKPISPRDLLAKVREVLDAGVKRVPLVRPLDKDRTSC
jgi:DNA-binding response OmpR family regulator